MLMEEIQYPLMPYVFLKYINSHNQILKGYMCPKDYEDYVLSCEEVKWKEIKRNKILNATAITWLEINDE